MLELEYLNECIKTKIRSNTVVIALVGPTGGYGTRTLLFSPLTFVPAGG